MEAVRRKRTDESSGNATNKTGRRSLKGDDTDMKPQTVEMQEWYEDLTVQRANYCGLKVAAMVFASWIVVGVVLWLAGLFK